MYNYREEVTDSCVDAIKEYLDCHQVGGMSKDKLYDDMYDAFWISDSVTGNASGSFTFNAYKAGEYLTGNWDLVTEAMQEFGETDVNPMEKGEEWCDVTVRCYLLSECLHKAMEKLDDEIEKALGNE